MSNENDVLEESLSADLELNDEQQALQKTLALRAAIQKASGDQLSLLGTTADGAGLALICVAELLAKMAAVQSLADVRKIGDDYTEVFASFLAARASGESIMTSDVKGWGMVLADVQERNTSVIQVLSASAANGGES